MSSLRKQDRRGGLLHVRGGVGLAAVVIITIIVIIIIGYLENRLSIPMVFTAGLER